MFRLTFRSITGPVKPLTTRGKVIGKYSPKGWKLAN
jgi:hypothetical protein